MAYRTGVSTSRGLSSLADHVGVSPVPLFDRVLRGGAALEIGCGEGRALLELQQRHGRVDGRCDGLRLIQFSQ